MHITRSPLAWALLAGLATLPLAAHAQGFQGTVVEGDYLNLSFTGDGKTPSAMALFEAQERALSAPRAAAEATDLGDAAYGIGLPLPPARLSPELSLTYSSAGSSHSWIARGWTLNAAMAITRVTGREASQAYAEFDEIYRIAGGGLDGLLIPVAAGWQYVSTRGVAAQIERLGASWLVRAGGVKTLLEPEFGTLGTEGAPAVRWHAGQARDTTGNTVSYEWTGSRLDRVHYGGATDESGSIVPGAEHVVDVRLMWSPRARLSYRAQSGLMDVITDRLDEIRIHTQYDTPSFDEQSHTTPSRRAGGRRRRESRPSRSTRP